MRALHGKYTSNCELCGCTYTYTNIRTGGETGRLCKKCRDRRYYDKLPKVVRVVKKCSECGVEYSRTLGNLAKYKDLCKKCSDKKISSERNKGKDIFKEWAKNSIVNHISHNRPLPIDVESLSNLAKNTQFCSICKIKLFYGRDNGLTGERPTADRIRNGSSRFTTDVGIICSRCNSLKSDTEFEEFKTRISGWVQHIRISEPTYSP